MKITAVLALSGALLTGTATTTAAAWLSNVDPHPLVTGLPGAELWPAAVASVATQASPPDPDTAPPAQVRAFFAALTPALQAELARQAPGVVGNLDGAPTQLRLAANAMASGQPPARRLLGYDPRGDGTVIELFGDLDTARHIAVLVPGSGWRLDNALAAVEPVNPAWVAGQLREQVRRLDPEAAVAVVAWLGYDTPEAVDRQAVRSARAAAGAPRLARFLAGLPAGAHISVLCHSYGAVVCGLAVPPSPVAEAVALAAPGMDVGDAASVRIARRVWAARTAGDHIRFAPSVRVGGYGHGADPVDPDFGAVVFDTGDARGHDGYYQPGTESLANLARIVLGQVGQVTSAAAP